VAADPAVTLIFTAVQEAAMNSVHQVWADQASGEDLLRPDTHKVVTLVIITKVMRHQGLAEQADILVDTEDQMVVRESL
jgi:hypothetical protein